MLPEDKSYYLFIRELLEHEPSVGIDFFPPFNPRQIVLSLFFSMDFAKSSFHNCKTSSKFKIKTFLIYSSFNYLRINPNSTSDHIDFRLLSIYFLGKPHGHFLST